MVAGRPVRIHSVAEAYLLLMVTPCEACGKGPLQAADHESVDLGGASARRMAARCQACDHSHEFLFDLSDVQELDPSGAASDLPCINPTEESSRAIDLAQWLMLFEAIVRAADQQSDPAESRRLGYEAAQCLEEALKFYPPSPAEWPDESAFFHAWTLERFAGHRHLFARTRLVDLRRKLPTLTQMERRLRREPDSSSAMSADGARRRPWWAFWRR